MEESPGSIALVALGGFGGAALRHGVDLAVVAALGSPAAVGTLTVNVVGALTLGFLVTRAVSRETQLLVGTGGLSSFTTYSTFAADAATLGAIDGALYVVVSYALGIAAGALGLAAGRRFP